MIHPDLLEILRCPMDPHRQTRLREESNHLVCPSCGIKYPIKDGFPVMVVEEAELPHDCPSLDQIPQRHEKTPAPSV